MIEREAQTEHDRPLIAAVIYNRLREGIPLGIDATIYYAVELQKGIATYTGELTESQLKIDSPYNTRTHKGLPPTPISNPGEASIDAAAHPAHVPLPLLRGRRRRLRRAGLLEDLRAVPEERRRLRGGGQEERRPSADVQEEVMQAPGRARLAGRAQPLAGDPQRGARRAGHARLALPAPAGAAGAVRRDDARARRSRASSAPT